MALTWAWASPSLRLSESNKKEELKIKDHTDGSLSIYKLPMKEKITLPQQMITGQSIGEQGVFQEKVLLVVGAAGCGKSTLINCMVNYIMGVKWEDDFRFKVAPEGVPIGNDQMKYLTAYTFYPMQGSPLSYKLTIIDTPGFGDTQGLKRDKDIVKQIKQFFSIPTPNGVRHIDGIAFVTQASHVHLTPNQEYIFNFILSILGKDLCKNIFLMITSADSHKPPILQALNDAKVTVSDRHFKFNNSVLFKDNKEDEDSFDALFWKMSFQALADFFTELSSTESVSIDKTMEVLNERDQLERLLEDMVQDVTISAKRFDEMQKDERMHKAQKCHVRLNEIALKPNPGLSLDHLQLLIESEKQQGESGWMQRIEYLEDVKRQAEMLFNKKCRLAEIARREELILKDGTPSIYKLAMEENLTDEKRMIAKHSVGEPGQFQEKVLLVIGATGAGKSTLINGMANYIMGVKWEDDFRFKVVTDDPNVSTSKSQTKFITAYTFYPMEGSALSYKLTVIDTPGFGDTQGLKRDKDVVKQIQQFFSIPTPNGVRHIDGIAFVTQASHVHLTPNQEYIFNFILSILGKDLCKNIFLMITSADSHKPPILQALNDAKVTVSDRHFKFNNSVLFKDNKEDEDSFDALFWKMSFRALADFFTEFSSTESVSVDLTMEVLNKRDQLQRLLEDMIQDITIGTKRFEEMQEDERMHKARKCHVRLNEIALKPNPALNFDHLQLLIESEKQQAESGWFQRVEYLKDVKLQAEMLFNKKRRLAEIARREELILKDGTPSIYKLAMEENLTDEKRMIAKHSVGEPGQFQEKVLLVIGATGAGKSTLINGMANYIMGVKWEDDFRFKVVTDDPNVSTSKSQTKFITAYTFYPMEGSALSYKLTIIDTPGFGDSQGLKRDKDVVKQIQQFFSIPSPNGVRHIDGIAFVTQASLVRLTPNQEYIFNFILSMLGKDLCKNIFLMITSADSHKPPILQALNDAKVTVSDRHFKFNNSVLFKDNKEDEDSFDALFWKMSFQALADFFTELSSTESVSIDKTMEVLNEREQLQRLLEDMVQDVTIDAKSFEKIQGDEKMHKARKCHVRLNEIALKPNPALNFDHLQLLIESEKQQAESGWFQRVEYLKDVKLQAEMLFNKKRRLAEIARREELILKDGTPSIYKLAMEENLTDEKRMIAKHSVGEPGQFQEKVLLVIGATGAGKSTLINGMANYIMGVKWEDDFRFKVVTDDPNVSTSKSQTKFITAYTFYPMEGSALSYKLTIIDTPGFGDTEGLKRDKAITKQIEEFFSIPLPNGVSHLDGVGFVAQGSLARLTPTQEYIFSSVLSIFGKDLSQSIFMMVTFADGQKPPVLKAIKDAGVTKSVKHFKFNNSALFADNREGNFDAMFWKMGFLSFKSFFEELLKAKSVHLDLTKEVLKERDQLQALLEGLNPQINLGLEKIEEMRQEEIVLQHRESEIETSKEFTYTVEVNKPHQVDISGEGKHTTTCIKCNFTCHNECAYSDDNDKVKCCAMSGDNCVVCPKKCHWTEHKNLPYVWEFKKVVETRTSEDLKRKYESAKEGKSKVESMIDKLDEELQKMHFEVVNNILKAQQCLRRLDEIALKPNPLSNVEYIELLIESEKQTANHGWKQRIRYLEEAKRQAAMLSKVTAVKASKEKVEESTRSGDKWYSRFKFWEKK